MMLLATHPSPSSAVYCIGNFALMLLSLLETILVMHLMGKDTSPENKTNTDNTSSEECNKQGNGIFNNCYGGEIRNQMRQTTGRKVGGVKHLLK